MSNPIVSTVKPGLLLHSHAIPPVNLRPTGQTWPNVVCPITIAGLNLVVFRQNHRTRTDYGHPFCQDEKTRLPAEMLRLDS